MHVGDTTEEDFLKCLRPTYLGDFNLKGRDLRLKGQNRIGNLVVENRNYCEFEDWLNVGLFVFVTSGGPMQQDMTHFLARLVCLSFGARPPFVGHSQEPAVARYGKRSDWINMFLPVLLPPAPTEFSSFSRLNCLLNR